MTDDDTNPIRPGDCYAKLSRSQADYARDNRERAIALMVESKLFKDDQISYLFKQLAVLTDARADNMIEVAALLADIGARLNVLGRQPDDTEIEP